MCFFRKSLIVKTMDISAELSAQAAEYVCIAQILVSMQNIETQLVDELFSSECVIAK